MHPGGFRQTDPLRGLPENAIQCPENPPQGGTRTFEPKASVALQSG
jgi:hypothetical protein